MPMTPASKQDKCPFEPDAVMSMEGCHSMTVCVQAAQRITAIAERCQNLNQMERFGLGPYILLHAARVHLMEAAIPTPKPTRTGCEPSFQLLGMIRRKEQAVDRFHRSLGCLRKFSVYHWTVNGIGVSIRTLERTLAAILQEQEMDQELELERQRQKLAEYDAGFFEQDGTMTDTSTTAVSAEVPKERCSIMDDGTAGENKSEEDSSNERAYYEAMRFLEMRLLYQERHRYSKDNHLEEHLQRQDSQPLLTAGMDLSPRRSFTFDKNGKRYSL